MAEAAPAPFITAAYDGVAASEAELARHATMIDHGAHTALAVYVGFAFVVGFVLAWLIYRRGLGVGERIATALKPLHTLLELARRRYEEWDYERGCPFGNLAQEMCDLSPAMCEKLRGVLDGLSRAMGDILNEAAARGELAPGVEPYEAAAFVMDAWEGAILRMKAEKNAQPLLRLEKMLFTRILAAPLPETAKTAETAGAPTSTGA